MPHPDSPLCRSVIALTWFLAVGFSAKATETASADATPHAFNLPAGEAAWSLRQFSLQSGIQLLMSSPDLQGVRTNPVRGSFANLEALRRMLAGTNLEAREDRRTQAIAVVAIRHPPSDHRVVSSSASAGETSHPTGKGAVSPEVAGGNSPQTEPVPTRSRVTAGNRVVALPQFTVSDTTVDRYRAADAISAVRVRAPLSETGASISVLTNEFIRDVAPQRLFDATRYVAGVQEGRGVTFNDRQIIRGFESEYRTVDSFFDQSSSNFEEALIDRIEVTKGPNAILSPGGVPGGSINVITKSPRFDRQRSITALLGLYDAQKITLDATDQLGEHPALAYRVIAAFQDSRRYWAADARLKDKVFSPQLTWRPRPNTEVTIKYAHVDSWVFREPLLILDPSTGPTGMPLIASPLRAQSRNGIDPWSGLSDHNDSIQVDSNSAINERVSARFAARAAWAYEDSKQEIISTPGLSDRYDPYTGELTQDYTWAINPSTGQYVSSYAPYFDPVRIPIHGEEAHALTRSLAVQNDWVAKFARPAMTLQTVAGWAYSHQRYDDRRHDGIVPAIDLLSPRPEADAVWSPLLSRDQHAKTTSWQAYLNGRLSTADNRLIMSGGYLAYLTDSRAVDYVAPDAGGIIQGSRAMYLGSVLYKVAPGVAFYYSYSSNATPTIVNRSGLWRIGRQNELGAKIELMHQRFALNGAYYEIAQSNVSVPNPEHLLDPSAPVSLLSNYRNHGVELEATGRVTNEVSILASVTRMRLRDSLGRPVRAISDQLASLMLSYRPDRGPWKGIAVNLGGVFTGKRAGDAPPNFTPLNVVGKSSFVIPAYTIYNLGLAYQMRRYLLRCYVDNLADKKDFVYMAGSRVATGTYPGRNVRFSATVKF